jgi:hypothetical protein
MYKNIISISIAILLTIPNLKSVIVSPGGHSPEDILEQDFITTAESGNLSKIKSLIKENPTLESANYLDKAIIAAAENGHLRIVKYLISQKTKDTDPKDEYSLKAAQQSLNKLSAKLPYEKYSNKNYQKTRTIIRKEYSRLQRLIDENRLQKEKEGLYGNI